MNDRPDHTGDPDERNSGTGDGSGKTVASSEGACEGAGGSPQVVRGETGESAPGDQGSDARTLEELRAVFESARADAIEKLDPATLAEIESDWDVPTGVHEERKLKNTELLKDIAREALPSYVDE